MIKTATRLFCVLLGVICIGLLIIYQLSKGTPLWFPMLGIAPLLFLTTIAVFRLEDEVLLLASGILVGFIMALF